jgi:hypothetical protein
MKIHRLTLTMKALVLIFLTSFALGCGESFSPANYLAPEPETENDGASGDEINDELQICSKLDFSGINWPTNFNTGSQNSFALALNITSSFEGSQSWSTIAGDSDGQALSLGLLQQNLGSGTLQPLMAQMQKLHKNKMQSFFSAPHWASLSAMLSDWTSTSSVVIASPLLFSDQKLFQSDTDVLSSLDENAFVNEFQSFATPAVNKTLTWARQNILTGKTIKADWKREFQNLANSVEYRNFQFREAIDLHLTTEAYREYFKFKTLAGYLFLFDIVVQNGGFYDSNKTAYETYVKQNPNASEAQKLKKLLEIRLTSVRSQYRNDVNARKSTIINGSGTVHGSLRNLPKEYCFQGSIQIDPT